jgi:hypothetical protein
MPLMLPQATQSCKLWLRVTSRTPTPVPRIIERPGSTLLKFLVNPQIAQSKRWFPRQILRDQLRGTRPFTHRIGHGRAPRPKRLLSAFGAVDGGLMLDL